MNTATQNPLTIEQLKFEIAPGLIIDLNERPLSYSKIKEFAKSPAHYVAAIQHKFERSEEMVFGSMVDIMLMTPDETDKKYASIPTTFNLRSPADRQKKASLEFDYLKAGKEIIDPVQKDKAEKMLAAIKRNPKAMWLMDRCPERQKEFRWTDKETGLPLITKLDMAGDTIITEFKTAASAEPSAWGGVCYKWRYDIQAAFYVEAYRVIKNVYPDFWYIVVEKEEPYGVSVLKADPEKFIAKGQKEMRRLLQWFKYSIEGCLWEKSYDYATASGYFVTELPKYAYYGQ